MHEEIFVVGRHRGVDPTPSTPTSTTPSSRGRSSSVVVVVVVVFGLKVNRAVKKKKGHGMGSELVKVHVTHSELVCDLKM